MKKLLTLGLGAALSACFLILLLMFQTSCSSSPTAPAKTPTPVPATATVTSTPTITITRTITNTPTPTLTKTVTGTPTNTPTIGSPTATLTATSTSTVTSTNTPSVNFKFEDFENNTDWGPVAGPPTNGWAMSSVAGYAGGTNAFQQSSTSHSGSYSMQFNTVLTAAYGYGFFGFYSSYATAFGGPINTQVSGAAPTGLSCWIYSSQPTAIYFGVWDNATHTSYTNAFTPGSTSVPTANTWTNVEVPIIAAGGAPWDGNISTIDWTNITYVLIGPNDLTGAASNTITVKIDDVYFY